MNIRRELFGESSYLIATVPYYTHEKLQVKRKISELFISWQVYMNKFLL